MKHNPHDTRAELLRAALVCFAAHGYDGASMRMIAEEAKRPISLFSHYFGNKEGLYVAVFKWILGHGLPGLARMSEPDTDREPRDQMEALAMLREQIHYFYLEGVPEARAGNPEHEAAVVLMLQEIRECRSSLHELFFNHFSPRTKILQRCIKHLRPDLEDAKVVFLGISLVGIVVGHGLMSGLNKVIWGSAVAAHSSFLESELLVDFYLHGLLGAARQA